MNRSIEFLSISGFDLNSSMDTFGILAPFFEQNPNLRCISINCTNVSKTIPNFISAIVQAKSMRLQRLVLTASDIEDERAAELVDALNSWTGLSHLLDLLRRIVFITSHAWHWVSCLEILPLVCNDYYLIGMSLTIRAWWISLGV